MNHQTVIDATRRWVRDVVIGLNLCPFAGRPFDAGLVRYAVSDARDERTLLADLTAEIDRLAAAPPAELETTLLIHPHVLAEFLDYNDFLGVAERQIKKRGKLGVLQVASFHPLYQFEDTKPDDVENYTNRSPYPMLHLLREASITAVADDAEALLEIPRRNVALLRRLGHEHLRRMLLAATTGTDDTPTAPS